MQHHEEIPQTDADALAIGNSDLDALRETLADRARDCLDRLDDVVAELAVLHDVSPELIAERARRVASAERLQHRREG
jgi:hypothetical protein